MWQVMTTTTMCIILTKAIQMLLLWRRHGGICCVSCLIFLLFQNGGGYLCPRFKINDMELLNYFSRVLCALMLCAGLVFTGCAEDQLGEDPNTEQDGNGNGDNGGQQDKPAGGDKVTSGPVTVTIGEITATTVTFKGTIDVSDADKDFSQVTIRYAEPEGFNAVDESLPKVVCTTFDENNEFSIVLTNLKYGTNYKYCVIAKVRTEETYSDKVMSFTTAALNCTLSFVSATATSARIEGVVDGVSESDKSLIEVGLIYSSDEGEVKKGEGSKLTASEISSAKTVSYDLSGLTYGTVYYYCSYVRQGENYVCGDIKEFTTSNISVSASAKDTTVISVIPVAEFTGTVTGLSEEDKSYIEVGLAYYTTSEGLKTDSSTKKTVSIDADGAFEVSESLSLGCQYYYCTYIKQNGMYEYGAEVKDLQTVHPYTVGTESDLNVSAATDLSSLESANSYIVSHSGLYKFSTVKGNSTESVGSIASASVLWETFGTSEVPEGFDLIKAFCYKDGYIAFQTPDVFKEGNAVIAAKDASGTILWSWHIWMTDQPEEQEYFNDAGIMMDRNLGATSATPGDVGALGLLYQWGRKDPFLSGESIDSGWLVAKSTITWPSDVTSNKTRGTIGYSIANPTTFIRANTGYDSLDWNYPGTTTTGKTRWTGSSSPKSLYDPCPAGWRVPDGGVWARAANTAGNFDYPIDGSNKGMNFSGKFGSASTIWYPASGSIGYSGDDVNSVGSYGYYWSASPFTYFGAKYTLWFSYDTVSTRAYNSPSEALSVRCSKEIK